MRLINDKSWADALRFEVLSDKLVDQSSSGTGVCALNSLLDAKFVKEITCFWGSQVFSFGKLHFQCFFESLHHWDSAEWRCKVNLVDLVWVFRFVLRVVLNYEGTGELLDHLREKFFSESHQVVVVGVGLIELTGREFRVVSQVNALISELLSDFEHAVHTSNDELFEVKFRSNTHEKLHGEVIMESLERLSSSTSSNHVHHWGLDFCKVAFS